MAIFKIHGKPKKISKEELRAMLNAASTIMEFHNKDTHKSVNKIDVYLKDVKYLPGKTKTGTQIIGTARRKDREINLVSRLGFNEMLTAVIHEVIHIYMGMDDYCIEKCTSTLVNRLKPHVVDIYEELIDGVYERAAYIAHTKMSYIPTGQDHYDKDENIPVKCDTVKKYRRNGGNNLGEREEIRRSESEVQS